MYIINIALCTYFCQSIFCTKYNFFIYFFNML
nr:MAG TPA_asm: hypothetical protein [Caudoviricetes sp.]